MYELQVEVGGQQTGQDGGYNRIGKLPQQGNESAHGFSWPGSSNVLLVLSIHNDLSTRTEAGVGTGLGRNGRPLRKPPSRTRFADGVD